MAVLSKKEKLGALNSGPSAEAPIPEWPGLPPSLKSRCKPEELEDYQKAVTEFFKKTGTIRS